MVEWVVVVQRTTYLEFASIESIVVELFSGSGSLEILRRLNFLFIASCAHILHFLGDMLWPRHGQES